MRISRHYVDQSLAVDRQILLTGLPARHLTRVLRVRDGQPVILFNGDGADYLATVQGRERDGLRLLIGERQPVDKESPLHITLVQAIARGERMDQVLQKATELGVAVIQPLISERVEVKLAGARLQKRLNHWQGVITSACEQCGRARIPALAEPVVFRDWLVQSPPHALILHPQTTTPLAAHLAGRPGFSDLDAGVVIAIGPEGGFSEEEMQAADAMGRQRVSLGPRVLRTETAGPTAISVLQTLAGDFAATKVAPTD